GGQDRRAPRKTNHERQCSSPIKHRFRFVRNASLRLSSPPQRGGEVAAKRSERGPATLACSLVEFQGRRLPLAVSASPSHLSPTLWGRGTGPTTASALLPSLPIGAAARAFHLGSCPMARRRRPLRR